VTVEATGYELGHLVFDGGVHGVVPLLGLSLPRRPARGRRRGARAAHARLPGAAPRRAAPRRRDVAEVRADRGPATSRTVSSATSTLASTTPRIPAAPSQSRPAAPAPLRSRPSRRAASRPPARASWNLRRPTFLSLVNVVTSWSHSAPVAARWSKPWSLSWSWLGRRDGHRPSCVGSRSRSRPRASWDRPPAVWGARLLQPAPLCVVAVDLCAMPTRESPDPAPRRVDLRSPKPQVT